MKVRPIITRSWDESQLYQFGEGEDVPPVLVFESVEPCSPSYFQYLVRFNEEQNPDWFYKIISMRYDPVGALIFIQYEILNGPIPTP